MLAVDESCRRMGLGRFIYFFCLLTIVSGTKLVRRAIDNMRRNGCDEVYLETEVITLFIPCEVCILGQQHNSTRTIRKIGIYSRQETYQVDHLVTFGGSMSSFRYYLNGNDAFRLKLFFAPVC